MCKLAGLSDRLGPGQPVSLDVAYLIAAALGPLDNEWSISVALHMTNLPGFRIAVNNQSGHAGIPGYAGMGLDNGIATCEDTGMQNSVEIISPAEIARGGMYGVTNHQTRQSCQLPQHRGFCGETETRCNRDVDSRRAADGR